MNETTEVKRRGRPPGQKEPAPEARPYVPYPIGSLVQVATNSLVFPGKRVVVTHYDDRLESYRVHLEDEPKRDGSIHRKRILGAILGATAKPPAQEPGAPVPPTPEKPVPPTRNSVTGRVVNFDALDPVPYVAGAAWGGRPDPSIRINTKSISLNAAAIRALSNPARIRLSYDPVQRVIVFEPTSASSGLAYQSPSKEGGAAGTINARGFYRRFGITPIGEVTPVVRNGRLYVLLP